MRSRLHTNAATRATAGLVALALLTACTSGADTNPPGPSTDQGGSTGTVTEIVRAAPVLEADVTVVLEDDESVVAVSPSGERLVTVTEPAIPEGHDDWVVDVCVRSGADYQTVDCVDGGELAIYPRGAVWNQDESLLAFVYPRSNRRNVVSVLDLATGAVSALTDEEVVDRSMVLTWLGEGRIAYSVTSDGDTQIRTVDPADPEAEPQVLQTLTDTSIDQLFAVGDRLAFEGTVGIAKGVYDVGDGTDDPQRRVPLRADTAVFATDTPGERFAVQAWDAHFALPVLLAEVDSDDLVELSEHDPTRFAAGASFAPGDEHLVVLNYAGVGADLDIYDRDRQLVARHAIERPADSSYHHGVEWTDRGVVVVTSIDGQADQVLLYADAQLSGSAAVG